MPHIRITTTNAHIGIHQKRPYLHTHTYLPHVPRRTRYPRVILRREEPYLTIDQSHVRAELGYRQRPDFDRYAAQKGQRAALKGIKKMAREGDRMTRFYSGENAIAAIARESSFTRAELNIACWPTRPPDITVNTGGLDIHLQPGSTSSDYRPAQVQGDFTWALVQVYMRQKPDIEIKAVLDQKA